MLWVPLSRTQTTVALPRRSSQARVEEAGARLRDRDRAAEGRPRRPHRGPRRSLRRRPRPTRRRPHPLLADSDFVEERPVFSVADVRGDREGAARRPGRGLQEAPGRPCQAPDEGRGAVGGHPEDRASRGAARGRRRRRAARRPRPPARSPPAPWSPSHRCAASSRSRFRPRRRRFPRFRRPPPIRRTWAGALKSWPACRPAVWMTKSVPSKAVQTTVALPAASTAERAPLAAFTDSSFAHSSAPVPLPGFGAGSGEIRFAVVNTPPAGRTVAITNAGLGQWIGLLGGFGLTPQTKSGNSDSDRTPPGDDHVAAVGSRCAGSVGSPEPGAVAVPDGSSVRRRPFQGDRLPPGGLVAIWIVFTPVGFRSASRRPRLRRRVSSPTAVRRP